MRLTRSRGNHKDPARVFAQAAQEKCLEKAQEIVDEIHNQGLTPIDTGRLAGLLPESEGYHVERRKTGAAVVTDVYYWKYVEFGTTRNGAQPHVRPAYEAVKARGDT